MLKEVTNRCKAEIYLMKQDLPEETNVRIWEEGQTRFVLAYKEKNKKVSITNISRQVTQQEWAIAIKDIMKLDMADVFISNKENGVVDITEKPSSFPRVAY